MYEDTVIKREKKPVESFWKRFFHRRTKRLFSDLEKEYNHFLNAFVIHSLVLLLFGVIFAIWGSISGFVIRFMSSFLLLSYGILHCYFYRRRRQFPFYKYSVFYGVFGVVIGFLCLFLSDLDLNRLLIFFGIYYLVSMLEHVLASFALVRVKDHQVLLLGVSSLLMIFMAILLFINPFLHLYLRETLGVFLILYGILNLTELSFLRKKAQKILSFND